MSYGQLPRTKSIAAQIIQILHELDRVSHLKACPVKAANGPPALLLLEVASHGSRTLLCTDSKVLERFYTVIKKLHVQKQQLWDTT